MEFYIRRKLFPAVVIYRVPLVLTFAPRGPLLPYNPHPHALEPLNSPKVHVWMGFLCYFTLHRIQD